MTQAPTITRGVSPLWPEAPHATDTICPVIMPEPPLWREVDALEHASGRNAAYRRALWDVKDILERRGFTEQADAPTTGASAPGEVWRFTAVISGRERPPIDSVDELLRLINGGARISSIRRIRTPAPSAAERLAVVEGENARLREALAELEAANDALCAQRSIATYLSMIDVDGSTDALERLDAARRAARAALDPAS